MFAKIAVPAGCTLPGHEQMDSGDPLARFAAETGVAILTDSAHRQQAAEDFGHLTTGSPKGVVLPRTLEEISRIVGFANAQGLHLTPRGRGFSQGGQSVSVGSLTLDLSHLGRVDEPDSISQTIRCETGARWHTIIERTAPFGFIPRVVPLNLDLTVGGTLAVGGVGATSHRFGPIVSNVAKVELVTGRGEHQVGDFQRNRAAVDSTLGALGRFAILLSATLYLRKFQPRVRTYYLLYDKLAPWLADQQRLMQSDRCDYLEAFCSASIQGLRNDPIGRRPFAHWFYVLHASFEYSPGGEPERQTALAGLHPYRLTHVEDNDTITFAYRYAPRFEAMQRTGAWQEAHPWVECFLPADALPHLLPRLLDAVPLFLGDGHRLVFLAGSQQPRFFMTPPCDQVVGFAILPTGIPAPLRQTALSALDAVHRMLIEAGGKRYLSGWLGKPDEDTLRTHFGPRYCEWKAAKERFDPNHVLTSHFLGD